MNYFYVADEELAACNFNLDDYKQERRKHCTVLSVNKDTKYQCLCLYSQTEINKSVKSPKCYPY